MRLQNFLIVVEDVERSKRFYTELFGLQVMREFEGNVVLTEGLVLQEKTIWEQLIGKSVQGRGHDAELYFVEPRLDRFLDKVEASDLEVAWIHPPVGQESGRRVVRLYDPDGHVIEVAEPAPGI